MLGKQDVMFAGGGEELDWTLSCLFDAMGAMSSKYNDTPERASRAFDADRDGFVISGGGAMVVLEPLERAVARGARSMPRSRALPPPPTGRHGRPLGRGRRAGDARALRRCPRTARSATSTPTAPRPRWATWARSRPCAASSARVHAARQLHQVDDRPRQGAAGALEAIFCLLMLKDDFIAPSINVETLDPALKPEEIATALVEMPGSTR
jgi:3-oxoacyl-[acyl-carrier-protein] synthase-1